MTTTRRASTLDFLPTTRAEMRERGWEQCDFVYVSGDAYVDHPSFGTAIIARLLEAHGYKVGIIAQPDWRDPASVTRLGEPRLGFLVSAGNMDSMVNHYTVAKRHRSKDYYSPGGKMGLRPDHAVVVYSNLIRRTYKKNPIILGGIEASLRRLAHYDYWSDSLKRSVLIDAGADLISYGMGEHSTRVSTCVTSRSFKGRSIARAPSSSASSQSSYPRGRRSPPARKSMRAALASRFAS